ncbi:hypothetical protein GW17_00026313 [Ensete ventricosum]|nr:hypothetical protein GW17_00026313 [Ensete ventricosum]
MSVRRALVPASWSVLHRVSLFSSLVIFAVLFYLCHSVLWSCVTREEVLLQLAGRRSFASRSASSLQQACLDTIRSWFLKQVPPQGKGSLYIRPLLIGSGPVLGLAPAPDYMFLVYAAPVGTYFKCHINLLRLQEGLAPINLVIDDNTHRATPGGTGGVKTITNYAPVFFLLLFTLSSII